MVLETLAAGCQFIRRPLQSIYVQITGSGSGAGTPNPGDGPVSCVGEWSLTAAAEHTWERDASEARQPWQVFPYGGETLPALYPLGGGFIVWRAGCGNDVVAFGSAVDGGESLVGQLELGTWTQRVVTVTYDGDEVETGRVEDEMSGAVIVVLRLRQAGAVWELEVGATLVPAWGEVSASVTRPIERGSLGEMVGTYDLVLRDEAITVCGGGTSRQTVAARVIIA
jgi:hypothetical protein